MTTISPNTPTQSQQSDNPVVLSAHNLGKRFGGFEAVKGLTLDVHDKSVHALIGPNGAGKTTVFNLLTKFIQPTSGQVKLLGKDITLTPPDRIARLGMVRSFQICAIFPDMTVVENIRVALQRPNSLSIQFWKPRSSLRVLNVRSEELAELVGLSDVLHTRAADLSYGRKRVLELATTLALEPRVLLLDEPLAGMGHEDIDMVAGIIRKIGQTCAVLMVEHNLGIVANICHQITVLQRGEIISQGDFETISADPIVRSAYMGEEE